jgi:DNA polymerase III alpha subunit
MTMQCAYLATYYPMEWYAAVLTKGKSGDLQQYVGDIKRAGINILPVDINASKGSHVIENDTIRLSFSSVKGVGPAAIEKIVSAQPYKDFIDFLDRSGATKTNVTPLLRAGAFNSICVKPMAELESKYLEYANNPKLKTKKGRPDFLNIWNTQWTSTSVKFIDSEKEESWIELQEGDYPDYFKVLLENDLFGFSLRGSPFEILDRNKKIMRFFEDKLSTPTQFYYGIDLDDALASTNEVIVLPVLVKRIFEKPQRNGQMMAFLTFETMEGKEFDCPAFSSIWRNISKLVKKGNIYMGTFNRKFGEDPNSLLLGKPGFAHSVTSSQSFMIKVDELPL